MQLNEFPNNVRVDYSPLNLPNPSILTYEVVSNIPARALEEPRVTACRVLPDGPNNPIRRLRYIQVGDEVCNLSSIGGILCG
jgi:hypothetical protein